MKSLARISIQAGLVSPDMLAEFRRWGFVDEGTVKSEEVPDTPEKLLHLLNAALEEEHMVIMKETDVDALKAYLDSMAPGHLHLVEGDRSAHFPVTYGKLPSGEYLLPYRSDNVEELLTNTKTYLLDRDQMRVYFSEVRELFFGETKSFVACKPSMIEKDPDHELDRTLASAAG